GRVDRGLERALHRFGARVAVVNPLQKRAWSDLVEFFGERGLLRVIVIGAGDVYEFGRLSRDRFGDLRMRVSESANRHAGVEVEEYVSVHVFGHRAVAALHNERVAPGVAW